MTTGSDGITRRDFMGAATAGWVLGAALSEGAAAARTASPAVAPPWDELDAYDATGLAELVRRRRVSAEELLERAIARIERLDPVVNAVTVRHFELARSSLAALDPKAPFAGVPFLLKDLWVAMQGTATTNGSRFFAGAMADHDGELVKRFRRAGLVIVGKAASPELGMTTTTESALNGAVRNPYSLGRIAGGSSGGSAAAVAAGMVPIAHATDGGGSIRIPAACCDLVGLKPSRGRVPFSTRRYEGWAGLSVQFAVSRSVRDSARLLDAVAGPEAGAAAMAAPAPGAFLEATRRRSRPLRIARLRAPLSGTPVDPESERTADLAEEVCRRLGHTVADAKPKVDFKAYNAAFGTVLAVQTLAAIHAREAQLGRACTEADVEPVTWLIAQSGRSIDGLAYAAARDTFDQAARDMAAFHQDWDLLLSPTLAQPPVELGKLGLSPKDFRQYATDVSVFSPYTSLANVTGQPAISLPLRLDATGLPSGAMFLGRYAEEATLLSLAAALERELPWSGRRAGFRAAG